MPRLLLLATLLLAGCASAPSAPPAADDGPGRCPPRAELRPQERVPLTVPVDPTAETTGRLVPEQPPTAALVCRYGPAPGDASPPPVLPLAQEVALTAGLDRLPQDLLLPRDTGGGGSCTQALGPVTSYLLRLQYPDGVVWVSASEEVNGCVDTTNGPFRSDVGRADLLAAALDAGAWTTPPQRDADQRCVPERTGRLGQDTALLPAGATSLVLCRVAGDGVVRRTATAEQRAMVEDVLSDPVAVPSTGGCDGGGDLHELVARYPSGPSVLVRFVDRCRPDVDNGSLAAQLAPGDSRRLQALLTDAFEGSPGPG